MLIERDEEGYFVAEVQGDNLYALKAPPPYSAGRDLFRQPAEKIRRES